MVTSRPMVQEDSVELDAAIARSSHPGHDAVDYLQPNVYTEIWQDDHGPIVALRSSKALRLVATFYDEDDKGRNAKAVVLLLRDAVEKARASGFTEIIFHTDNPKLAQFCQKCMGFVPSNGENVLYI